MSTTGEIVTQVQTVGAALSDAQATGAQALNRAVELTDEAAAHGWDGVATSMQAVQDAMETALASLAAAADATAETLTILGAITDQMSRPDVADHLGQALNHLDQARTGVEATTSSVDDARTAAEQAGSPSALMSMLQVVSDEIDTVWRGVDDAKTSMETEQQASANWGN
jgi:hypothetical protein